MPKEIRTEYLPSVPEVAFDIRSLAQLWPSEYGKRLPQANLTYLGNITFTNIGYWPDEFLWLRHRQFSTYLRVMPSQYESSEQASKADATLEFQALTMTSEDSKAFAVNATLIVPRDVFTFLETSFMKGTEWHINWSPISVKFDITELGDHSILHFEPSLNWATAPLQLEKYNVSATCYKIPCTDGNSSIEEAAVLPVDDIEWHRNILPPPLWLLYQNNKTELEGTYNETLHELLQAVSERGKSKNWNELYNEGDYCVHWLQTLRYSSFRWTNLGEEKSRGVAFWPEKSLTLENHLFESDEKQKAATVRASLTGAEEYHFDLGSFIFDSSRDSDYAERIGLPLLRKTVPAASHSMCYAITLQTLACILEFGRNISKIDFDSTGNMTLPMLLQGLENSNDKTSTLITVWAHLWRLMVAFLAYQAAPDNPVVFWIVYLGLLTLRTVSNARTNKTPTQAIADECFSAMLTTYKHMTAGNTGKICLEYAYEAERKGAVWPPVMMSLLKQVSDEGLSFTRRN